MTVARTKVTLRVLKIRAAVCCRNPGSGFILVRLSSVRLVEPGERECVLGEVLSEAVLGS